MNAGWSRVPFLDAVDDVTRGHKKVKQRDYLSDGSLAVVDQGAELIGGYTDDTSARSHVPLPAIIFGDHTRCLKYVDFPFAVGADGVKVLRPRVGLEPKYLFHFLRSVQLHDGGYSRHFKFLKEIEVPVPPVETQRRIIVILDNAEALRQKRRLALTTFDSLARAMFIDVFSIDQWHAGVTSTTCPTGRLDDLAELRSGYGFPIDRQGRPTGQYPFAKVGDISTLARTGGRFLERAPNYVDDSDVRDLKARPFPPGTVAFAKIGEAIRQNFRVLSTVEVLLDNNVMGAVPRPGVHPSFLFGLLALIDLYPLAQSTTVPSIRKTELARLPVPLPDRALQDEFARLDKTFLDRRAQMGASLDLLDALSASLQQRAFQGEL